ncbi:hypothetical protein [Streptomyces sp. NPDC002994]|uniref:hypothetical protein n=1 Tax=Streptomyces sp. NPDC002994 TaxID=3154441 RepID=UPI0033B384A3
MSLHLITADLDAYDAEQQAARQRDEDTAPAVLAERDRLTTRYEIALDSGDDLDLRRAEALIAAHDHVHGGQLLTELAAA